MRQLRNFLLIGMLGFTTFCFGAAKPEYKGGEDALNAYISANLKYPTRAAANGIEGVVPLEFVVKADGSIGAIKVTRLIDPDLEAEAIRLVKSMPAWIPADNGETPVDATVTLPVKFVLD